MDVSDPSKPLKAQSPIHKTRIFFYLTSHSSRAEDERGRMLSMLWLPGLKLNFTSLNKTLTVQGRTVEKQKQNEIYPSLKRAVERRMVTPN